MITVGRIWGSGGQAVWAGGLAALPWAAPNISPWPSLPRSDRGRSGTIQVLAAPPRLRRRSGRLPRRSPGTVGNGTESGRSLAVRGRASPAASSLPHCSLSISRPGCSASAPAIPSGLQALRYNRHHCLGALRGAWFSVRDLRFQPAIFPACVPHSWAEAEALVLGRSPSRVERSRCLRLSALRQPGVQQKNWAAGGNAAFCHRQDGGLSSASGGIPPADPGFCPSLQTLGFLKPPPPSSSALHSARAGRMPLLANGRRTKVFASRAAGW